MACHRFLISQQRKLGEDVALVLRCAFLIPYPLVPSVNDGLERPSYVPFYAPSYVLVWGLAQKKTVLGWLGPGRLLSF